MAVSQEAIIQVIQKDGPILPAQLAKAIGSDILIASAHLSYLADNKKVKISNLKIGGSPVYYTEEQKSKLQELSSNLHDKDQQTFNLLKEKIVLMDDKLDQLTRVSLRTIKDFAVPLQVTKGKEKFLFWKWYLASDKDVQSMIGKYLNTSTDENFEDNLDEKNDEKKEVLTKKELNDKKQERSLEKDKIEKEKQALEKERRKIEEEKNHLKEEARRKLEEERKKLDSERKKIEEELIRSREEKRIRERQSIEEKKSEEEKRRKSEAERKNKLEEERKKKIEEERREIESERKKIEEERKRMQEELEKERQTMLKEIESNKQDTKKQEKPKSEDDPFFEQLLNYFKEKKISVVDHNIIRKKSEIDLVLKLPSVVGDLEYYCKAKNKKAISDSDLSSAVVQGQLKKLPVLFLSPGKLTKKAEELLNTELKKGLVIKNI